MTPHIAHLHLLAGLTAPPRRAHVDRMLRDVGLPEGGAPLARGW